MDEAEERIRQLRAFIESQPELRLPAGVTVDPWPEIRAALAEIAELQKLVDLRDELERGRQARLEREAAASAGGDVAGAATPRIIDGRPAILQLQSDLAAAGVVLSDELKRLGTELDLEFEDNLLRFRDYYERRAGLERQAIDQQLEAQRAALALVEEEIRVGQASGNDTTAAEERRAKLLAEITVLERQRADVAVNAGRGRARAG